MRFATWNINGLKARQEYLTRWLREVEPDVVGLQELKMSEEQFPAGAFEELGYHATVVGQKGWNGVAILSRHPISPTQRGLPGQEELGARLVTAQVRGLSFTTVYCPNGKSLEHEDFPRKLAWLDSLIAHVGEHQQSGRPAVVCGDFNVVPAPLDSWSEAALGGDLFHTEAERARIRALCDLGMTDLYRARHPDEPGFTWWDYRRGAFHKQQGLRIDLMFATAPVAGRVQAVHLQRQWRKKLDGLIPSDHAPVWVDLAE